MTPLKFFSDYYIARIEALEASNKLKGKKITGFESCFCVLRMDYWEWLLHTGQEDKDNPPPRDWKPMEINFPGGIPKIKDIGG